MNLIDCPTCGGHGTITLEADHYDGWIGHRNTKQRQECPTCEGRGEIQNPDACPWCDGLGYERDCNAHCHECDGSGQRREPKSTAPEIDWAAVALEIEKTKIAGVFGPSPYAEQMRKFQH